MAAHLDARKDAQPPRDPLTVSSLQCGRAFGCAEGLLHGLQPLVDLLLQCGRAFGCAEGVTYAVTIGAVT